MGLRRTFKFKLYKNHRLEKFEKQFNVACHIYNHSIALHKRYYKLFGKTLKKAKLQAHVAKLKRTRFPHWKKLNSQAAQNIAERIDFGYQKFFKKENQCPPKFRPRRKYRSITFKTSAWRLEGNNLIVQGKKYKFWKSREIEGKIKTVTIVKDSVGGFWVCFSCDNVECYRDRVTTGKIEGFDFGLKTFLTRSEGEPLRSPEFLKRSLDNLRKESRKFSKKKKLSSNWYRSKKTVARFHRHVAWQRLDYHFKLSNDLCKEYDLMFFEDLNIKAMQRLWGRKISDLGFSQFKSILKFKSQEWGVRVHKVDRFYPSSKTCSNCLEKNKDLTLKDRTFECKECGLSIDRDLNAAINIKREGASSLAALMSVRQASLASLAAESPSFSCG